MSRQDTVNGPVHSMHNASCSCSSFVFVACSKLAQNNARTNSELAELIKPVFKLTNNRFELVSLHYQIAHANLIMMRSGRQDLNN
jgi:hypothetical protein